MSGRLFYRSWLKVLLPRWSPQIKVFRVLLSHDVDHPLRYLTRWHLYKSMLGSPSAPKRYA